MWRIIPYLLGICCFVTASNCHAQNFKVSEPRLELRDNILHITYDILNSGPSDEFIVELVVTDAGGKRIPSVALSGDAGEKVSGGTGKHIAWDLAADRIEMNAQIFVKVHVRAVPPPESAAIAPAQEESVQESDVEVSQRSNEATPEESKSELTGRGFSRTSLILQSVAFPGLGLARLTGNPHWIMGVAGYGCLAGAVILNRTAISNYSGIMELSDFDEKNNLYQKSVSQDQVSEILAYTAIGIWVSNIVWTFVGTSDLKWSALNNRNGFSLITSVEPKSSAPIIGFVYSF
jgi:hypothetical protein